MSTTYDALTRGAAPPLDPSPAKRKSVITVAEAFILAILTYSVLGMWREVIDKVSHSVFGENKVLAAAVFTSVLVCMLFVFQNVDIGKSSLYELVA